MSTAIPNRRPRHPRKVRLFSRLIGQLRDTSPGYRERSPGLAAMWATLVKWLAEIRGEMFPPAGGLTRGSIHVDPGRLTGGLRACRWRRGSDCYARVGYRRTMCSDWSVSLV